MLFVALQHYFQEIQSFRFMCPLTSYISINSTMSLASSAGKVGDLSLMSQVGTVREFVCAYISVFQHSKMWNCQYSAADVLASIT